MLSGDIPAIKHLSARDLKGTPPKRLQNTGKYFTGTSMHIQFSTDWTASPKLKPKTGPQETK
jgi:hypothetical protein